VTSLGKKISEPLANDLSGARGMGIRKKGGTREKKKELNTPNNGGGSSPRLLLGHRVGGVKKGKKTRRDGGRVGRTATFAPKNDPPQPTKIRS